ncbi:P-loop containing nucleoside triphosphate hydrolase protein [Lichtheimia hyalospora FSU 10163]|nr:P-loop containing nucleoside triphosphate hydrolase protein [Lichtheimia hyalospora FSU 10163]
MTGHRRKPFSGKAKKAQLQARKARKAARQEQEPHPVNQEQQQHHESNITQEFVPAREAAPTFDSKHTGSSRKLVSSFEKLSSDTIEHARLASMKPLKKLPKTALEIGVDAFPDTMDFPKRPPWNYNMSKEQLEKRENEYFQEWVQGIYDRYEGQQSSLSWFERNLEVWRQLWRVLEISDIVIVVMDIRHPLLHFPRALYNYVTKELKRKIVGVFNKVDLVSEFTVFAWRKYFEQEFPELHITTFSCYPRDENLIDDTSTYVLKQRAKRPRKRYYHAQGIANILRTCSELELDNKSIHVDWPALIDRYDTTKDQDEEDEEEDENWDDESDTGSMVGLDDEFSRILDISNQQVTPHKDYITLGLVGHPNVGKSSLINSIMQKTVVSASRTPGHTKHFQTIHLTDNVRLCDSPGLVFPTLLPRALQILSGMYPIAQVQEPYSVVQYLAERVPVEKILALILPMDDVDQLSAFRWSAWTILEAYAIQRGFYTAKAARPDVYRAANTILRLTTDGRILMSFKPPGFFETSTYEKLRVEEQKQLAMAAQEQSNDDDDSDDSDMEQGDQGGKINITQGGAFALLADEMDD